MSEVRLFKLIVKDTGNPSKNGLRYIEKNIDIINKMGIKIKIIIIEEDSLNRAAVASLNSQGVVSFPAIITYEGGVRNGVDEIKSLFENGKRDYKIWLEQSNSTQNRRSINDTRFGDTDYGGNDTAGMTRAFFDKEMNMAALKRDQKNEEREEEGFGSNGDDFNRKIAENLNRRKLQAPGSNNNNFSSGGNVDLDDDDRMDNMNRNTSRNQRGRQYDDDEDNIMPPAMGRGRGGGGGGGVGEDNAVDIFEQRLMEGINDGGMSDY